MAKSTGVHTGTIIHVDDKQRRAGWYRKETKKKKNANKCIGCENNEGGYCKLHCVWCHAVNRSCNK